MVTEDIEKREIELLKTIDGVVTYLESQFPKENLADLKSYVEHKVLHGLYHSVFIQYDSLNAEPLPSVILDHYSKDKSENQNYFDRKFRKDQDWQGMNRSLVNETNAFAHTAMQNIRARYSFKLLEDQEDYISQLEQFTESFTEMINDYLKESDPRLSDPPQYKHDPEKMRNRLNESFRNPPTPDYVTIELSNGNTIDHSMN